MAMVVPEISINVPSIHHTSRHHSMMRPSPDIFETVSLRSCNKRTGAFSHHSDTRLACEMWASLHVCMGRNLVLHACVGS